MCYEPACCPEGESYTLDNTWGCARKRRHSWFCWIEWQLLTVVESAAPCSTTPALSDFMWHFVFWWSCFFNFVKKNKKRLNLFYILPFLPKASKALNVYLTSFPHLSRTVLLFKMIKDQFYPLLTGNYNIFKWMCHKRLHLMPSNLTFFFNFCD